MPLTPGIKDQLADLSRPICPSCGKADRKGWPPHLKVSFSWFFMFIDVILSCFLRNQFSWQNGQFVPKACRHFLKAIVVRVSYRTRVRSLVMRQCQIRVRFESRGMQFFKILKKWFWVTRYVPIIVLWCSERGFYKKVTWSPVSGVLPMPQITCLY